MGGDSYSSTSAPVPTSSAVPSSGNGMDDLMGIFGADPGLSVPTSSPGGNQDLMNGFAGLDLNGSGSQLQSSASKQTNEDILGLF